MKSIMPRFHSFPSCWFWLFIITDACGQQPIQYSRSGPGAGYELAP